MHNQNKTSVVKYLKSNITAKKGVNFVREIVESSGCLFHKIEQENDLGIDGIIEFIQDEKPANKSIAVQIKSGPSYFQSNKKTCVIPIENHRDYWSNYALPVCGIVYIPELGKGFWTNIKSHLENDKELKTIKFIADRSNQLDLANFNRLFLPNILNQTPDLTLIEAVSFFDSANENEFVLGSLILFRKYVNEKITWDKYINHILNDTLENLNGGIIYRLAHIPWHPDIWYRGESISEETKNYALKKINRFEKPEVIKLLSLIEEGIGIQRGTIGQSIEAILSKVNGIENILAEIINDKNIDLLIRHSASAIYAYYLQEKSFDLLENFTEEESWFIPILVDHIKEFKYYNPYQ
jgi:hypothetical protein